MKLPLPRSLSGQTLALMASTLLVTHLVGILIYTHDRGEAVTSTEAHDFAERVVGMVTLLQHLPQSWRDSVVRESDGRTFHVTLDPQPEAVGVDLDEDLSREISWYLMEQFPDWSDGRILVSFTDRPFVSRDAVEQRPRNGSSADVEPRDGAAPSSVYLHISLQIGEQSWLNFVGGMPETQRAWLIPASSYILSIMLGVGAIAMWLVFRVTGPLTTFSRAANRLGRDIRAEPLPETGPTEVRQAVQAFNLMQERLRRLVENRTQILAALSHDLKTPVSLLRLRAELMRDADEQIKVLHTIDEMETMIASVLEFTKATLVNEPRRRVDLSSMLDSICDDLSDAGADVAFEQTEPVLFSCRRVGLKRALTNLIDNAVKYGRRARVRLRDQEGHHVIEIDDDGPGIPEEKWDLIFMPFYRIDESRNTDAGGIGLGLSIAQSIVQGHGGDIAFEKPCAGGFRVRVALPK